MSNIIIFILAIGLAIVTVLGDFMIKKGSSENDLLNNWWIYGAALLYGATAFGWFFVLKKMKLSSAVVVYTVFLVFGVVALSALYFKEKINPSEYLGIILGIVSVIILYRFL